MTRAGKWGGFVSKRKKEGGFGSGKRKYVWGEGGKG